MSKHTPGPWQIIKFPEAVIIACNPKIDRCATICELPMPSTDEEAEEIEANARLTAAAPQLLEALGRLSRAATAVNQQRHDNPDPVPMFVALGEMLSAIKQADAAIATAKGEV